MYEIEQIGGHGCIVKIDESHVSSTAKYHRGRQLRRTHHWVFGSVDRCSGKHFIHCLGMGGKRDRETLEPLIIKYIKPGTTIISDSWGAISELCSL